MDLKTRKIVFFFRDRENKLCKQSFSMACVAKNPLWAMKTALSKTYKTLVFTKGSDHRFRQKCEISLTITFFPNRPRKSMWRRSA